MRYCKKDKDIESILNREAEGIEVSSDLFNKIRKNIYEEEQKGMIKNKGFGRKKCMALAAGLCLVIGTITAAAVNSGSWISSSHKVYDTFPTQQKVQKDAGYLPKYVDKLPGGFEFKDAYIGKGKKIDEAGKTETDTKEVSFSYEGKEGEKTSVMLNTTLVDKKYLADEAEKIAATYKDIELSYYNQTYKFVPEDYVPTAEDNKAMAAGQLEVSYGSDEVEIKQVQSISWYEDGVSYNIIGFDQSFEVDELINMAEAVIDAK